jgi:hypothetical protein
MSGEILHLSMVVAATRKARLVPSEFVSRVHLGHHQDKGGSVVDAVKGNLPGTYRDIPKTVLQQVSLGIQSLDGIVRRQLEGLQFLHQDCNRKRKNHQEEHNRAE